MCVSDGAVTFAPYVPSPRDRRDALRGSAWRAAGCLSFRLAQLQVPGQQPPALTALKTTIDSRKLLRGLAILCPARSAGRDTRARSSRSAKRAGNHLAPGAIR